MIVRKNCLLFAVAVVIIGACAFFARRPEDEKLPDLSSLGAIRVIGREEGSGTKDAFKMLLGTDEAGVNAVAASTALAIEMTASDANAIAYVASGAAADVKGVKVLSVNDVPAEHGGIASGKYPLIRPYLLAYKGELSELEIEFLMYIHGAGQQIVAEYCTPIAKATTFLSTKPAGTLKISGSSSVVPLMEQLVGDYCSRNPNAKITVEASDSAAGINSALRGDCDLAMSSRALKSYEAELLETGTIAVDGVAVIVNAANPLTGLSTKRLKAIYDGEVAEWSRLK